MVLGKVTARRHKDARLITELFTETEAVIGESRDIEKSVEATGRLNWKSKPESLKPW